MAITDPLHHTTLGEHDCIVVGAGAAGLMAAGNAASRGANTLVLESTSDGGKKILISGGGRCNVLPSRLDTSRYISSSDSKLLKKILRSWSLADQRRFFEGEIGLELALEEETGKLFPVSNRARDVRDGLVDWVRRAGGSFRFLTRVESIESDPAGGWRVITDDGLFRSKRLILATGGLSVPKTGSDGGGLEMARRIGHQIAPLYPALTPLLCSPPEHGDLAGLSLNVTLQATWKNERRAAAGGFLFTHRGYSGPTILDISDLPVRSSMVEGERGRIFVTWVEGSEEEWRRRLIDGGSNTLSSILRPILPARLADRLIFESGGEPGSRCAELERGVRERLIENLLRYRLRWTGDEGYRKAEVTGGGVRLEEVDPKTMESRSHPGLYLCGEMLDAFGPIGGYNFLWAWVTGRVAGIAAGAAKGGNSSS